VDCKFQDARLFIEVKKLSIKGLDPKSNLIDVHVTIANIAQIFSNVQKFRTTNPLLSKE
jgi:hypothetical protein